MYVLKLSMRPWRRSFYSQIFTSVAVGILLFLAGFLFWMQWGMGPVIEHLQNEQVITAYLDPSLSPQGETEAVNTIRDTIRTTVGAHAEIERVGTDEFLGHLRGDYPELVNELEALGSEMQAVIPRYVSISGMLPAQAVDQVRAIHGVQSAESSIDRFRNVIGAFRALKWIATLLTLSLVLALMTCLVHLGRTNAHLHRDSSSLMKLMGAGSFALRAPGWVSGCLVGLLGGLVAAGAWMSLGVSMTSHVRALSPILHAMSPIGSGGANHAFALGLVVAGFALGGISGGLAGGSGRGLARN